MIAVIGLFLYQRLQWPLKIFVVYLIIGSCTELLSYAFAQGSHTNLYFLHAFTLVEFWFMVIFFYHLLKLPYKKIVLYLALLLGSCGIIANSAVFQGFDVFNSYSATFVSAIIILLCLKYFHHIIDNADESVHGTTVKWCVIGLFFNHCISLMIIMYSNNILLCEKSTQTIIWVARTIFIIGTKLIFIAALLNCSYQFTKFFIKDKHSDLKQQKKLQY